MIIFATVRPKRQAGKPDVVRQTSKRTSGRSRKLKYAVIFNKMPNSGLEEESIRKILPLKGYSLISIVYNIDSREKIT
jgi:hypothetical protein